MQAVRKSPYLKWILWLVGLVGGLFFIGFLISLWLPTYFKSELDAALKRSVVDASDSLYRITYDDISINLPLGNAEVRGVKLTPDSTVYQSLLARQKAPNNQFALQANRVRLSGVALIKLLLHKSLSINTILIDQPVAYIVHNPQAYNDNKPSKSPYELISKVLKSVRIDKINLDNVDFTYENRQDSTQRPQKSQLKKLYLDVTDFLLDEDSGKDSSRIFFAQNMVLKAEGLELPSGNAQYVFRMQELSLSTRDSTLQVKNVLYEPLLSKNRFSRVTGYATDRLDLEFKNIKATQVDMKRFLVNRQLFAKKLYINAGLMDIDKDKRYPPDPNKETYYYPHQLLLKSKLKVGFETVYLKSTRVLYGELNPNTGRRGTLFFDGTHGTITNLTNDSAWIKRNPTCRVQVRTRFMNTGQLNAYFVFNLASRVGDFACGGTMNGFDMKRVNLISEALARASVTSGRVSKLNFKINASNVRSSIVMHMLYDDLKVAVLKVDDDTGKMKRRSFLSQVVNNIVLNENNPRENRPARVGEATVERARDESFFNLIWHTMFVSIKHIVIGRGKQKK
ncbi:hypothetical protein [Salmonirosea aquatica]|uniref:DUF748 domain-containing protein n=1 Tax=Salmonirosea aquatica TaxID=2654236 RepID=A0A7C9FZC8_9BACT|nr:hypothetical protein [Cytophagaceae bacterium SJW1-29]